MSQRQVHCTHIHAPSGQPLSAPQGCSVACSWLPPAIFFDGSFQTQFLLLKSPSPALALMIYSFFSSLLNEDACLPSSSPSQLPQNGLYFLLKIFFFGCRGSSIPPVGIFHCGLRAQLLPGMCELSSPTRDQTCLPSLARRILSQWITREALYFLFFGWIDKVQRPLRITAPS